jgi:tetratricopeptide (TPR) repeat protein
MRRLTPTTTNRWREVARRGEGSVDDLLAESRRLRGQLNYSAALAVARAAVTAHHATGDSGPQLAEARLLLGQLEENLGDLDAAETAYLAAAAATELAPLPVCRGIRVRALARLAAVLRGRGAIAEADAIVVEALAIAEAYVPDGLEHAEVVAEQSRQLIAHDAHEEAERLARRAIAMV